MVNITMDNKLFLDISDIINKFVNNEEKSKEIAFEVEIYLLCNLELNNKKT